MAEKMEEETSVTGRKRRPGMIRNKRDMSRKKVSNFRQHFCFRLDMETGGSTGS